MEKGAEAQEGACKERDMQKGGRGGPCKERGMQSKGQSGSEGDCKPARCALR